MIKRIVKLTFQEDKIDTFLGIFKESKSKIRNSKGCQHVELLREIDSGNIFFTFSIWENDASLDAYRQSEVFMETWAKTKVLFSDKPRAWTVNLIDQA